MATSSAATTSGKPDLMAPRYLIGVDLGTSATKAALYRPDGALVAEASAEVPLAYPSPGVVEQDQEDFFATARRTVREVIRSSGVAPTETAAIAFDSQMAGIGAVDEDFRPAMRFDSWLDMRCQPYIDDLVQNHADQITASTGCPPTCAHAAKMLWWQHERPEEYRRIAKFVVPAGYVAGRLAGMKSKMPSWTTASLAVSTCCRWSHARGRSRKRLPSSPPPRIMPR